MPTPEALISFFKSFTAGPLQQNWKNFCAEHRKGIRDPKLLPLEFLKLFPQVAATSAVYADSRAHALDPAACASRTLDAVAAPPHPRLKVEALVAAPAVPASQLRGMQCCVLSWSRLLHGTTSSSPRRPLLLHLATASS